MFCTGVGGANHRASYLYRVEGRLLLAQQHRTGRASSGALYVTVGGGTYSGLQRVNLQHAPYQEATKLRGLGGGFGLNRDSAISQSDFVSNSQSSAMFILYVIVLDPADIPDKNRHFHSFIHSLLRISFYRYSDKQARYFFNVNIILHCIF